MSDENIYQEGNVIFKGDDITLITGVFFDEYIVGISFSPNHGVYSMCRGAISEYKEWGYEKSQGDWDFDKGCSEFIEFLKDN